MSDKLLRVIVRVEEFALNSEESAFELSATRFISSFEYSDTSVYEALIRGTDAAISEFRGSQKK